jgi:hypothetical protein
MSELSNSISKTPSARLRERRDTLKAALGAGPLPESTAYPLRRERDLIEDELSKRRANGGVG